MKKPGFSTVSALMGIVLALIGLNSGNTFAQIPADVLKNIPFDYQHVAVINVQRLVESNLYARSRRESQLIGEIGNDLSEFVNNTGVDPARDISYLLVANSRSLSPFGDLIIATGRFDRKAIERQVLSRSRAAEWQYRGVSILPITVQDGIIQKALVFLSDQEIAIGPHPFLLQVLDTRAAAKKNILSDPLMASLIATVPSNEMFWLAGKSATTLAKAPVPIPAAAPGVQIQGVLGVFNVADCITGEIAIAAMGPNGATSLANYYSKMMTVAQSLEDPNSGLKLLSGGLAINTNRTQAHLALNFHADTLAKIWSWSHSSIEISETRNRMVESSKPIAIGKGVDAPIALFNPLRFYTAEARKKRREGRILMEVIIRKDGTPGAIKVLKGLGCGLDESAIQTIANRWRFIPGVVDGKAVDVMVQIEVSFHLY